MCFEIHTVNVRTRRERGISRQGLRNVAVGAIDIMVFLAIRKLKSLLIAIISRSLLG